MVIRRLTGRDVKAYRELRLRGLAEIPQAFGGGFAQEKKTKRAGYLADFGIGSRERFVLGAFESGTLVGVVGLRRFGGANLRHKATLWGMYVAPENRRSGAGNRLVETLVSRARRMAGLEWIVLGVEKGNRAARALYRRQGFLVYAVETKALKVGGRRYDEVWMRKGAARFS